jgi:hypothetical protein
MKTQDLHVVGAYSNPNQYATPKRLLRQWVSDTLDGGVSLTLVEHQTGEHPWDFAKDDPLFAHVNLVQVRGGAQHLLWLQHALYNRGIATLPETAKGICWQDTDIKHQRSDWATETLHMLQHYRVGQTWTNSVDLDPNGNVATNEWGNDVDRSFCAAWLAGDVDPKDGPYAPPVSRALLPKREEGKRDWRSHTGYSWAIRPDALAKLGRLLDWMIIGSGDYHMAHGFAGNLRQMCSSALSQPGDWTYSQSYFRKLLEFADQCDFAIQQDIGVVPGKIDHGWHGSKRLRFYGGREDVMREGRFDPDRDIVYDVHGLPMLTGRNPLLRDGLRRYNARRNADCIRVD